MNAASDDTLLKIRNGLPHEPVVYFLRLGGMVKIGTSTNLLQRVQTFSLSLQEVVAIVPGGGDVEAGFHRRFQKYRLRETSEWFFLVGALARFLAAVPGAPGSDGISLRSAVAAGLISGSLMAAKRARADDPRFPAAVAVDGQTLLYRPGDLRAWQDSRPRAAAGGA